MEEKTEATDRRTGFRWWMAIAAVGGLLLLGGAAAWLLIFRAVAVPDLQGKSVEEAVRLLTQADLKPAQEERQVNGAQLGVIIEQDPSPSSKVRHGATVKIFVAVAAKPISVVDLSGYWDSSSDLRYDVIQQGSDMFWRVRRSGSPDAPDKRGSASVAGNQVTSSKGAGVPSGRVTRTNDHGLAQVIKWDDGTIWFRTEAEGADLVLHYQLEKYDRVKLLDALKKARD